MIVIDKETQHPEIHYLGFWEEDTNSVSGTWEMKVSEEKYGDGYLEEIVNGGFEMQRIR